LTCSAALIDNAPQDLEDPWQAMDFIQNDELIALRAQIGIRFLHFVAVGGAFKI
jgi:hypothetical protein